MRLTPSRWQSRIGASAIALFSATLVVALQVPGATAASHRSATSSAGAVVTMAQGPLGTFAYIMPFVTGEGNVLANVDLQYQLWPTLYTWGTSKHPNALNTALSLAKPPVYSDGDTEVSVTLKSWKWSDGTPLSARDVTFFMNILKANKFDWAKYAPGDMPTNVASVTTQGKSTVVFKLTHSVNPTWFTDTQLARIVPLPQQAWDKESLAGPVRTYDTTTAGAKAVYSFLHAQGLDTSTYDTNPLWKVVDGPFKLAQYTSDHFVAIVPNTAYSGSQKPHIAKFELLPYTTSTAEFDAVLADSVDIGYVPANDVPEESRAESAGYKITPTALEGFDLASLNYNSPVTGPLVKQLYIRKALNDVMDQPGQIKAILHGDGYPDYGPVPQEPPSTYLSPLQEKNPFSISTARKLLTSHGWKIPANGAAKCDRPGTGPSDCGAGIKKGKALDFNLVYSTTAGYLQATMANYKSDASEAGIVINLSDQPFESIVEDICTTPDCDSPGWEIDNWGGEYYASPYPTGAIDFENHVGLDYPITKTFAALITATQTAPASQTVKAMRAYDAWVVENEPEVWTIDDYTDYAVSKNIENVTVSPVTGNVLPQDFVVK